MSLACGSQNLVSSNAEKPSFKYSEDFIFMEAFCFFLDQLIQCVISRASVTGEGSAVVHVGSFPRPYRRHPMFRRLVKPGGGIGIHLGKPSLWVSKLIPGGWRLHKEPSVVPQNCDHPLVRLFSLVTSYARRLSRLHILVLETLVCISH